MVANNVGFVRGIFLEGCDGFFGAAFLGDTNNGVEDENGQDLISQFR